MFFYSYAEGNPFFPLLFFSFFIITNLWRIYDYYYAAAADVSHSTRQCCNRLCFLLYQKDSSITLCRIFFFPFLLVHNSQLLCFALLCWMKVCLLTVRHTLPDLMLSSSEKSSRDRVSFASLTTRRLMVCFICKTFHSSNVIRHFGLGQLNCWRVSSVWCWGLVSLN